MVPQSELDRRKEEILLLNQGVCEELVIAFKETLGVVCSMMEDLAFSLI